ncbi:hypothetical protein SLEP1_g50983 [Rubroshorea leprosula]|uniref:Rad51-like C-terminal domain-containing protein n=1 Tax=Rubroshorea leprosula TaxID=152421 RepID=A0AAV5M1R3_9ROSI|nr:hypothetical protein SLEP1_g50983 [Rubroshorea leprosula]
MIATLKAEEASQHQLQLVEVEREDINDEEDLFEAIASSSVVLSYDLKCVALCAVISAGINTGDVRKLQKAGIYTCNGLMMHTRKHLTGIKGLSEAKVDKICKAAEKIVFPTSMKGGNGKVAYIDTEGTFRPDRVVPIAERFGMDSGAVLDNIIYARAYTYEHQYNLLLGLAAKMAEEPFTLPITCSMQKLAQMLSRLTKIAEEFNVAVYMTNQVIADPGGGVFISDPKKPARGHVLAHALAHAATIRLMFRKGEGE